MKVLNFNQTGNPRNVLSLTDVPKPEPGPDEALIKVLASPINPSDILFIKGDYRLKPDLPQTAGLEGAGIIETTGKNVTIPAGTLVTFKTSNAWAEYAVSPKSLVIPLPNDFSVEKAAQFYINSTTAWGLLYESKAKAGEWLLLTAGNSAVSKITIQLAKRQNIKVIGVVRNMKQAEDLKQLGADSVLNQYEDEFLDQIDEITSGEGVQAALDAVGGKTGTKVLQSMAPEGRIIIYGLLSEEPAQFYNSTVIYKNLFIKGFGIRGYLQSLGEEQKGKMISGLIEAMAEHDFQLPVEKAFPLDQFREALAANKQSNREGKIIFRN